MSLFGFMSTETLGLAFVLIFLALMIILATGKRERSWRSFRHIPAFVRLRRSIGLAVEAGQRLHISLGRGGLDGPQAGSAFIGLSILQRIVRVASVSDRPPVASSGNALLAILAQDTTRATMRNIGMSSQVDPAAGQLTGLTPFAYAAGAVPIILDQQVSVNLIAGSMGSEVGLMMDAADRSGSLTLAGSDQLAAQAVLFATAQEPLIGEELYAAGAYLQAGPFHASSVRTQDVFRWIVAGGILAGAILKMVGLL